MAVGLLGGPVVAAGIRAAVVVVAAGGRAGGRRRQMSTARRVLQRMVDETGGRLFEVSKKETVADIYKQIGEELRAQYRLAFTPDKDTSAAGYHRIDLSLTKSSPKDLSIQTRDGYYTGD